MCDIWGETITPPPCRQIYDHRFWNAWFFGLEGPWNFLFWDFCNLCESHRKLRLLLPVTIFFSRSSGFPKVNIDGFEQIISSSTFCWSLTLLTQCLHRGSLRYGLWAQVCNFYRLDTAMQLLPFGHSYVASTVSHTEVDLSKFQSILKAIREFPKRKNLPSWTFLCFRKHAVAFCKCPWHFSRIFLKN